MKTTFIATVICFSVISCAKEQGSTSDVGAISIADSPLVQLPFYGGSKSQCLQGVEGIHEHTGNDSLYDLDFAAPSADASVLAPIGGTVHLVTDGKFGNQINIDFGADSYILVGFMGKVIVAEGQEVATGQLLGMPGAVHGGNLGVHLGLHRGNAATQKGAAGTSAPMHRVVASEVGSAIGVSEMEASAFVCGRSGDVIEGNFYESVNRGAGQHLPGTLIKTAGDPRVYLVRTDMSFSWIKSIDIFRTSGFTDAMIVVVPSEEVACNNRGEDVAAPLAKSAAGLLADGTLVKEAGKPDVYVVSGGTAWPVITWNVFLLAGYQAANIQEVSANTLKGKVLSVGDCSRGDHCLDAVYLQTCNANPVVPPTGSGGTNGSGGIEGSGGSGSGGSVGSDGSLNGSGGKHGSGGMTGSGGLLKADAGVVEDAGVADVFPADAGTESAAPDFGWVYSSSGTKLCLNSWYFTGSDRAVLLVWSGPGANPALGPVASLEAGSYCWDFQGKETGLYSFWADVPDAACKTAICLRDTVASNGAQYQSAPKVTGTARHWLACDYSGCSNGGACGCDGMAYFDGKYWFPQGNQ